MSQPVDLYAWRNAIMSELGPANPLARVVLMAVSLHMKADGTGAWPSQTLIAARACVGERSARRHLEIAERHGWVERTRVRRDKGHSWYRTEYAACVPDAVYDQLPERPWEADPEWRREQPATVAATSPRNGSETLSTGQSEQNNRPLVTEYRPTTTKQPANGDTNNRPELGLLTLPLNSSCNSSKNSSQEGALARTALGKRFCERTAEEKAEESRIKLHQAIERFLKAGSFTAEDILHNLKSLGVTREDITAVRQRMNDKALPSVEGVNEAESLSNSHASASPVGESHG